jgi:hypothetical protein
MRSSAQESVVISTFHTGALLRILLKCDAGCLAEEVRVPFAA